MTKQDRKVFHEKLDEMLDTAFQLESAIIDVMIIHNVSEGDRIKSTSLSCVFATNDEGVYAFEEGPNAVVDEYDAQEQS